MLYKNEEDAKRTFLSMMAVPDWGRRIAPAEWGIEGTEELDIADVFDGTPKIKLSKLKSDFNIKTIAILALVIVLIAWGGFALLSHFSDTEEIIEEVAPPPVVKPVVEKPKTTSTMRIIVITTGCFTENSETFICYSPLIKLLFVSASD